MMLINITQATGPASVLRVRRDGVPIEPRTPGYQTEASRAFLAGLTGLRLHGLFAAICAEIMLVNVYEWGVKLVFRLVLPDALTGEPKLFETVSPVWSPAESLSPADFLLLHVRTFFEHEAAEDVRRDGNTLYPVEH